MQVEFLRVEHVIFRPRNAREHGARGELLIVEAEALHDCFDQRELIGFVVDDEVLGVADGRLSGRGRRDAQGFNVAAQDAHAERVEGGDDGLGDAQSADQFFDALGHLGGGLVGEGHGEDGFGHHAQVFDEMRDAIGDYAGFAAARAGEDQHRALGGFDGFALLRVELVEKGHGGSGSGVGESILQGIGGATGKGEVSMAGAVPNGIRCPLSFYPALPCRAFTCRRLRGWGSGAV